MTSPMLYTENGALEGSLTMNHQAFAPGEEFSHVPMDF